jgi:toxin ParE1/3/4
MPDYILTNKALEDISRIWDYTYEKWSEEHADKYYSLILISCEELANKRVVGKKYPEVHPDVFGYKIGQHIIFYRPTKGGKVEVARVLHSRMDLRSRLDE